MNEIILEEMKDQAKIIEENEEINCLECMDFGYIEDSETGKTTTCDCMQEENPLDFIDNKIF